MIENRALHQWHGGLGSGGRRLSLRLVYNFGYGKKTRRASTEAESKVSSAIMLPY